MSGSSGEAGGREGGSDQGSERERDNRYKLLGKEKEKGKEPISFKGNEEKIDADKRRKRECKKKKP